MHSFSPKCRPSRESFTDPACKPIQLSFPLSFFFLSLSQILLTPSGCLQVSNKRKDSKQSWVGSRREEGRVEEDPTSSKFVCLAVSLFPPYKHIATELLRLAFSLPHWKLAWKEREREKVSPNSRRKKVGWASIKLLPSSFLTTLADCEGRFQQLNSFRSSASSLRRYLWHDHEFSGDIKAQRKQKEK